MKSFLGGRIVAIGAVAAGLTAVIVLAGQLGYTLPTFVRAADITAMHAAMAEERVKLRVMLVGGQKENAANILIIQLNGNQGLIYMNKAEQERQLRKGPVSDTLRQQERFLLKEDARLRRELQKLEE